VHLEVLIVCPRSDRTFNHLSDAFDRLSAQRADLVRTVRRTGRDATMADPVAGTTDSRSSSHGSHSQQAVQVRDSPGKGRQTKQLMLGFLIALVLVSIMATTYISAEHLPVAHNLPWGVTGPSWLSCLIRGSIRRHDDPVGVGSSHLGRAGRVQSGARVP
jgi:hypothetical protein